MRALKVNPGLIDQEPWIITASGIRLHPFAAAVNEIDILDVAASLSRKCRFSGNMTDKYPNDIYTVAQHSVYVAWTVKDRTRSRLWAILHDASEFPFGDMVSPVKSRFPDYRKAEDNFAEVVRARWDVPYDTAIKEDVDHADYSMFFVEAKEMLNTEAEHWSSTRPVGTIYDIDPNFRPWGPAEARERFLLEFQDAYADNYQS